MFCVGKLFVISKFYGPQNIGDKDTCADERDISLHFLELYLMKFLVSKGNKNWLLKVTGVVIAIESKTIDFHT